MNIVVLSSSQNMFALNFYETDIYIFLIISLFMQ